MIFFLQVIVIGVVLALGYWAFKRKSPDGCPVCGQEKGGCTGEGDRTCEKPTLKKNDEKLLLFITQLPLGASYKQIRLTFPQIPELKVPGQKESFEINAPVIFSERTAYVNLHLKNGLLESYYFWLKNMTDREQESFFEKFKNFYISKLGQQTKEYSCEQCKWNTEKFTVRLTKIKNDQKAVMWGFEPLD